VTPSDQKISRYQTVKAFFLSGKACSGTLCQVLDCAFKHPMHEEEYAAMPLAGGVLQQGYQCGMIWGAALAAGAEAHRRHDAGAQAQVRAVNAARELIETFRAQNRFSDCYDITEIDSSSTTKQMISYFLLRGGAVGCAQRAARYAPAARDAVNQAFSEKSNESLSLPVSCSALFARKTGCSDMHETMLAGFAGGIGLSGGGCGVLAAAIWLIGLNKLRDGAQQLLYKTSESDALIEEFLKYTDYEFECQTIVGRRFDTVTDHAGYLSGGGCAKIIDAMAFLVNSAKTIDSRHSGVRQH
jgi:hypothetical protein